jgi:fibronectin type 3 domain-containing protein
MKVRSGWLLAAGLLVAAALVASCGRKTDPLTPDSPRPEMVHDVKAVARDVSVFLSWPVPTKNAEGKVMNPAALFGFRVFRAEIEPDRKRARFHQVAEIALVDPAPASIRNNVVYWSDGPLKYGRVYAYRVVALGTKGDVASPSLEVRIAPLLSLAPPRAIKAIGGEQRVELAWEAVSTRSDGSVFNGFIGYNVYRRDEGGAYGEIPLNKEPLRATTYTDSNAQNDKAYFYTVRAVDSPALPWKESLDAPEATATPKKVTPPERPTGLTVVPGVGRVFLTWNENKERDIAGYYLYRSTKSGRDRERLNDKPLARTTYSDETVEPGRSYYYVVTAVDQSGNESQPCKEQATYTEKLR